MARFKQLYRIIEDVVNAIKWEIPVNNIVDNGDGTFTLDVDCTSYLNPCYVFKDSNGDKWSVESFLFNESLTVKAYGHQKVWTASEINLTIPKYIHGTVKLSDAEYSKTKDQKEVHPLIYLYETITENVSLDSKMAIQRKARIQVFFLMNNNPEGFTQINYDVDIYDPLSNIEEKFIDELLKNRNISTFTEDYSRKNHEQFSYADREGYTESVFSGNLSALELMIPLNVNKCNNKDLNC